MEQARRSDRPITACRCATASRLAAGPTIFCQKLAKCRGFQHLVGQQLLQLRVLVFQGLQALGVRHVHAAILRLPVIQRRLGDPVLAGQVASLRTRLVLAEHRDDLLLYSVSSSQGVTFDSGSLLLFAVGM